MPEIAAVWFAQRALVPHGGRLLAVRVAAGPWSGRWDLPGGRLGPGESLDEALAREVREETGVRVVPGATAELARWTYELGGRPRDVVAAYRYAALVGDPEPTLDH